MPFSLRSSVRGDLRVSGGCGRRHDDARPCGQGRASQRCGGQAAEPSATRDEEEERDEPAFDADELDADELDEDELDADELDADEDPEPESELDDEDVPESPAPFEPESLLPAATEAEEPLRESVR
jgi:hypothetical protein